MFEDEIRKRLIWKCELCEDVIVSHSHLRHTLDTCDCGKTSVDMEEFYTRILGDNFVFISEKIKENGEKKMKVNIELPEIEGFSYTGEYRFPDKGEYYEHEGSALESTYNMGCSRFILKKVVKWRKVNCLEDIGKEARFRDLHSEEWKEGYL